MIKAANKNICVLPGGHCGITLEFRKPGTRSKDDKGHNGTDWGAKVGYSYYEDVRACQGGVVREVGYSGVSSQIGYYCVIESQYDDNTHAFFGYIHLKEAAKVKKGDKVEAGQVIGVRGGSPYKDSNKSQPLFTPHLHLYTTPATTKGYSWNTMKELACNPFDIYTFCKLKGVSYDMAVKDGHNFNNAPIYEEMIKTDSDEIKELKEKVAELTDQINAANQKLEKVKTISSQLNEAIK